MEQRKLHQAGVIISQEHCTLECTYYNYGIEEVLSEKIRSYMILAKCFMCYNISPGQCGEPKIWS